jgi:hypothetical protein
MEIEMGMDIFGKSDGEAYFRASVWQWRPLHCLMAEANQRFKLGISEKLLSGMAFNSGVGLKTARHCERLADALDKLLSEYGENITIDMDPTGAEGAMMEMLSSAGWNLAGNQPAYSVSQEQVREFISFLRMCGGFEVW